MSAKLTVQRYMIEPARGILTSANLHVSTVVLLRIVTAEHGEISYVLSPVDALQMALCLREQAEIAQADRKIVSE